MKKYIRLLTVFATLSVAKTFGQCPITPSVTVQSTVGASCPSNGAVTLNGNGIGNANVIYKIVSAPNGSYIGTTRQGTNPTFINLEPGVYKIEMSCAAGGTAKDTATATIANNYIAPSADLSSSSACSGGSAQVTLALSNIQGSSLPLQYAFYQTNNPNIADTMLTYGSATSQTFTSFGNFIVRIKDACGNYITKTISMVAPPTYYVSPSISNVAACDKFNCALYLKDSANTTYDLTTIPPGGITINVYYPQGPNSCTKGALYYTQSYAAGTPIAGITYPAPRQRFIVEAINACGTAMSKCVDTNSVRSRTEWSITNSSCSVPASNVTLVWRSNSRFYGTVTYCAYKNNVLRACSNNPYDLLFTNIASAPGDKFYVIATDQCGISTTSDTFTTPTAAPSASVEWASLSCTDGKLSVSINVSNVPKADLATLVITSGPCCVGTVIGTNLSNSFRVDDLLVPGTYTAKISYRGGECYDIPGLTFTIVPPNSTQTFNATVSQTCGGLASITARVNAQGSTTWGSNSSEYQLVDMSNNIVQSNTTGVFNGINPGTYTVKGIVTFTGCTPNKVVTSQKTIIVTAPGAPPVISKKYGIICENGAGNQLANGSAVFNIEGFGPYDVYYSSTNNQPANAQMTAQNSPVIVTGLAANQTYYFWFKDACGNTSSSQLGIGSLSGLWVEQLTQPCAGTPFQLSMPDYIGATYTWKDTSGNILGNDRTMNFGNYQVSSDGHYIGIMTMANGCLTRTVEVALSSVLCGTPLPLKLLSFYAKKEKAYNDLNWSTADEKNVTHFEIERSADGANWNVIAIISVDAKLAITHDYSYQDQQPIDGTNYYRLKIVDKGHGYQYSQVVVIRKNGAVNAGTAMHVYPNPAHAVVTVELPAEAVGAQLSIYNSIGVAIAKQSVVSPQTTINTEAYTPGLYYIVVTKDNTVLYREKLNKL